MLQTLMKDALKEWAVTIKALDEGKQHLLLRKGGIREKEFKVEHEEFLLYPTFEHQRSDLLKHEYQEDLRATLAPWNGQAPTEPPSSVTFTHFARVRDVIEVTDPAHVTALSPFYIWTTDYAEKRLHWRPRKPLEILLVRAYRLEHPVVVPVSPYFAGCKSWVELGDGLPLGALTPMVSEERFQAEAQRIREVLK
ncbi:MAG: DUF1802 family protein [Chloroflexi bacterium]|nr:DUF1802 family protein [Chloroflexota bacterium]